MSNVSWVADVLSLTTGTPGAGKTLWTLAHVEAMRVKENREVFYWNINELKLPWQKLDDPKKWFDCPPNSIIVIDEAQDVFPTRGNGQAVPPHVERMAKHRHQGLDVFLISQHPMKLDTNIRKDVEAHRHLMRKFGAHWSTVHWWKGVRDNCEKSRKDSLSSEWRFPKKSFEWYKSAEVHTHKVTVPWKLVIPLVAAVILLPYTGYRIFYADRGVEAAKTAAAPAKGGPGIPGLPSPAAAQAKAVVTPAEYAAAQLPRIPGFLHSAPMYDKLTEASKVPVPAACVQSASKGCRCWTQEATPYAIDAAMCAQIVAGGLFLPFEPSPKREGPQQAGYKPAAAVPPAPAPAATLILHDSEPPSRGTVADLVRAHREITR